MIDLASVTYSYPSTPSPPAIRDLSLSIRHGQFVAVLGENGSGKSTMARLLNGLILPDRGSVTVDGMSTSDAEDVWEIRQRLGMVFHNPESQIVATTVEEEVAFGLENAGVPRDVMRRRIGWALETVGLAGTELREPHLLSGGQKQRLSIAAVLAVQPRHVVLDEATSMLDVTGRRELLSTLRRLNADLGVTVVLITHFVEEAIEADRVVVLRNGTIALDGPPRELLPEGSRLREAGIRPPFAVEMADELREAGVPLARDIYLPNELVDALCRLT
ncbi:MAG: energy-coupling factor transporter ATPase [Actinobacteria bacterium]|nr:MAG: energy-coupling factor transporter ATPase [Actinomycetota bacterium]